MLVKSGVEGVEVRGEWKVSSGQISVVFCCQIIKSGGGIERADVLTKLEILLGALGVCGIRTVPTPNSKLRAFTKLRTKKKSHHQPDTFLNKPKRADPRLARRVKSSSRTFGTVTPGIARHCHYLVADLVIGGY